MSSPTASSAPSCLPTRSRCAPTSATRASRTSGSCATRRPRPSSRSTRSCRSIPLVVTPDGEGMQDSTPIIERIEALLPEPSIHPADPVARVRLGAARGVRRRVGQQVDVPLPLGARGRPGSAPPAASPRAMMPAGRRRQHAGMRGADPRADGRSRLVRRLERADGAADRGLLPRGARAARRAPGRAPLSVRRAPGVRATSASGASSTRPGPIRPPARSIEGRAPRVLAWIHRMLWPRAEGDFERWTRSSRRCCRSSSARWDASSCPGRRQRRGDRGRQRGVQRRARRPQPGPRSRRSTTRSRSRRCARSTPRSRTDRALDAVLERSRLSRGAPRARLNPGARSDPEES